MTFPDDVRTMKAKLYKWNVSEAKITRKDGQNFPFVTHGKPLVTHVEFLMLMGNNPIPSS